MMNSRSRTRLHMGCGEALSGRLVCQTETRATNKLKKRCEVEQNTKGKHRRVTGK